MVGDVVAAMPPGLNARGIRGPRGGGMQPVRDELNLDVVVLRAATISNKVAYYPFWKTRIAVLCSELEGPVLRPVACFQQGRRPERRSTDRNASGA